MPLGRTFLVVSFITAAAALIQAPCSAHDAVTTQLTWSRDVSRIVYRHCASCHHDGGAAMPLITYAQARPWATAMKEVVLARTMPPWGAVKGFRPLQNDPTLSQDEIDRIAQWVEGGAPEGDQKFLPAAPAVNAPADVPYRRVSLAESLPADLTLIGLAPESDAADARITAELPDGRILPLLWLHGYKGQWRRAYRFVDPVVLPRGTRIRCSPSIRVEGLIAAPKPGR